MKKLLALVLALVMTLSLCTVSNAKYSDAAEVDFDEAVEVLSAVGVFQGDENGKFLPKATLTREAAAKLIAYLALGKDVAEALPAVKVFNDVEANRWSAKYIAYCADAGFIAGDGNGNFLPAAELTGYAFGKMVLCVLGYDAKIEGFTGSSWSIKVAKLMESNDIADGVKTAASAALSREAAAQYCLNALQADMVEYENKGSSLAVNGATIDFGASKAEKVANTKFDYRVETGLTDDDDQVMQLCEKLYKEDIKLLADEEDDLGRPCSEWYYDDMTEAVTTSVEKADYVFVCDDEYADLEDAVEEILDKDDFDYGDADIEDNDYELVAGTVVELYMTKKVVDYAVYYAYQYAAIDEVDTDVSAADKKDGVSAYITYDGTLAGLGEIDDTDVPGFNAATYVEDAYVAYILNGEEELVSTAIAKTIETSVSTVKASDDYLTVDGTKYYVSGYYTGDTALGEVVPGKDNTYTLVFDANGYIIGIEEVKASATKLDEVYIATIGWEVNSSSEYGGTVRKAQLVSLDGKEKIVDVEAADANWQKGKIYKLVTISDKKVTEGTTTTCKANNGKYNLNSWNWEDEEKFDVIEATNNEFTKTMTRDDAAFRFDSKTQYVLIGDAGSDLVVSTYVGGIKLDATSMEVVYITAHDKTLVQYVVIVDKDDEIKTNTEFTKDVVYITEFTDEIGDEYFYQEVYMADGSKATLKIDSSNEYDEPGFYKYAKNDDGFYELDQTDVYMTAPTDDIVWDDETGAIEGIFTGILYDSKLMTVLEVNDGEDIEDIKVTNAKVVDTRSASMIENSPYDREIKSLSALDKAAEECGGLTVAMNVSKDGVATIFVVGTPT